MVTTRRPDIVVAWELVVDEIEMRPEPPRPRAAVAPNDPGHADHCPACASRLIEPYSGGDALRCLSCARVWAIEADGLHLRARIIVDP